MKRHAPLLFGCLLAVVLATFSGMQAGIIPAIIPAAAPTANKTGTGSRFATSTAAGTSGNCAQWSAAGDVGDAGGPCAAGSGITTLTQDVSAGPGSGSQAATVVGINAVPLCSGFSPTNLQFLQFTTGGTPNPCYSATTVGASAFVLVEEHTASTSAALNFTTCISSTYDDYQIRVINLLIGTSAQRFLWQMSTNGGSTYDTGNNYQWATTFAVAGGAGGVEGSGADSGIQFSSGQSDSSATFGGTSGTYNLHNPLSATAFKPIDGISMQKDSRDSTGSKRDLGAVYASATAVNAFRFISSSGTITSGTVRCYGLTH